MSTYLGNKSKQGKQYSQRDYRAGGVAKAKPYTPDLSSFMSLCDANYAKLKQLLPDFENKDVRVFGLSRQQHVLGKIKIEIQERCKYTTTLELVQESGTDFSEANTQIASAQMTSTQMIVRLYHDARMAEVLSYQGVGKLKAVYKYPNKQMMQQDEKALCNEFLADWLSYCLKFGHSLGFENSLELKNSLEPESSREENFQ
jgi:uncharacterized protein YqiB (DUF1249 family)